MKWAFAIVAVLAAAAPARTARALDVPRCCRAGAALPPQAFSVPLTRDAAAAACAPLDAADPAFEPLVYAPARGAFLERGRMPPHWREAPARIPACPLLHPLSVHAAPYALLANNASLLLRGAARALAADRYCAEPRGALVCADDAPRVPAKCCAEAYAWDGAHCVEAAAEGAAALLELRAATGGGAVTFGWPACAEGSRYVESGALGGGTLVADGSLALAGGAAAAGAWCAEGVVGASGARVFACESAATGDGAAPLRHRLYGGALAVGALFLAATLWASFTLPAAHRALHWRCQTHYVAALFLGDVLLAATQLAGGAVPPPLCRTLAVCMHFLFLAAFFWLNTMCFNIWWTFRDFRPTSAERSQEACRLRVYRVYAWGAPLALSVAAAALDAPAWPTASIASPALPGASSPLRPRFAERRCWFAGDAELLVYFFGPVGVLLLVNVALFAATARQLTCGLWRRDELKSTSERAALGRVCAKLVVVMGVTWGADVVSWAAGGPHYLWYATDLLNALQGALIFLVVGWHQHARAALRRAVPRLPPRRAPSASHLPSCGDSLTHTTPAAPPPPSAATPAPPLGASALAAATKIPMETVC